VDKVPSLVASFRVGEEIGREARKYLVTLHVKGSVPTSCV